MQVSHVGKFFARRFVAKTAKTFVFYLLFLAVEVLKMTCLHRKNSVQCKFRRWTVLPTAFFCAVTTVKCFVIANHQSVLSVSHCLFLQKTVAFCFVISCLSVFRF